MPAYGADPAALDALAQSMSQAAQALDQIGAQLGARVNTSPWRGPVADAFRQRWISAYYPALRAAHGELTSASTELAKNAHDQSTASSASGGTTSSAPTRGGANSVDDSLLHNLAFDLLPRSLELTGELLDRLKDAGSTIESLSAALAGIGWAFSLRQLVDDATTPQNFRGIHVFADGLELVGSTATIVGSVLITPPATPVGFVVLGAGFVAEGVGTGVNMAVDFWDKEGGREMWHTAAPWVAHELDRAGSETWHLAYSGASDVASGAEHVAKGAWHAATGWL